MGDNDVRNVWLSRFQRLLDMRWFYELSPYQQLNYVLIVCGTFCSYVSVYAGLWDPEHWNDNLYNADDFQQLLNGSNNFDNVCVASAVIAVPALADSFLDLYVYCMDDGLASKSASKIRHMSIIERIMFCTGMLLTLVARTGQSKAEAGLIEQYYYCSNASTVLLTLCPIILFLSRVNNKVFTDQRSFVLILNITFSCVLQGASALFTGGTVVYSAFWWLSNAFMVLTGVVYFGIVGFEVWKYATIHRMQKKKRVGNSATSADGQSDINSIASSEYDAAEKATNNETLIAHMFNSGILIILTIYWYCYPTPNEIFLVSYTAFNIAVACSVLVVEMRVRKKEISRGMSQLDSKRAFVRYISHEMRTPLSAAAMGLALLESDLEEENGAEGELEGTWLDRHGDVLRMVQDSFTRAETICSDLLQYDKFEDDNLPVFKQTYNAVELLDGLLEPFHVLARRAVINLQVDAVTDRREPLATLLSKRHRNTEGDDGAQFDRDAGTVAEAALLASLVDVDRQKLNHVLSNLLSNAYKFSPVGGTVTVSLFLSDILGPEALAKLEKAQEDGAVQSSGKSSVSASPRGVASPVLSSSALRKHSVGSSESPSIQSLLGIKGSAKAGDDVEAAVAGVDDSKGGDAQPSTATRKSSVGDIMANLSKRTSVRVITKMRSRQFRRRLADNLLARAQQSLFGQSTNEIERFSDMVNDDPDPALHGANGKKKSYLVVCVTDSGVGIAKENIRSVFNSIVQFNPNELQGGGGSGLGMVLSRGIVDRHGGKMWLQSEGIGHGSTFSFGIPLSKAARATADARTGAPLKIGGGVESKAAAAAHASSNPMKPNDGTVSETRPYRSVGSIKSVSASGRSGVDSASPVAPAAAGMAHSEEDTPISARTSTKPPSAKPGASLPSYGAKNGGGGKVFMEPIAAASASYEANSGDAAALVDPALRPLLAQLERRASLSMVQRRTSQMGASVKTKRVLVVEDDYVSRTMMVKVLEKFGYIVEEAEDGAEALAMMQAALKGVNGELPFDLVLSDWVMPNMEGPESVEKMRQAGYRGPVFGVTGNQLPADINHFIAKGADKIIAKPLKLPALMKAIEEYEAAAAAKKQQEAPLSLAVPAEVKEAEVPSPGMASSTTPFTTAVDGAPTTSAGHGSSRLALLKSSAGGGGGGEATPAAAVKRVLIAEDDAVCRKMLARVLKGLKYEVAEAEDGAAALQLMRAALAGRDGQQPYDLVLSDYTMPNMDGPESVAGMREAGYTGPIFGVTGNQLQADIDHFVAKGADKIIAKPLKLPALKQAIEEYEDQSRRSGANKQAHV